MKNKVNDFVNLNKQKIFIIFVLYCVSACSIGVVNYPYIDDIARRIEGVGNFAAHYSRYLSEFASYIVQGSHHLTDTGLTTFVVSAIILTLTSVVVLYVMFDGEQISWVSTMGSVFIGINPWFLEPISFRFDAPYICLSVFVSVIPFLFFYSKKRYYFLLSIVGIFLMCNSYQGSSGIYIIMLLTLIYRDFLKGVEISELLKKLLISALAYVISMGVYLLETKLNPELALRGDTTSIAPLKAMPAAVFNNLRVYFITLKSQSTNAWLYLAIVLFIMFFVYMTYSSKINKLISSIFGIIYIALGSILSFGVYMFFSTPLADDRPRYEYGFAYFIAIIMILLGSYSSNKVIDYVKGLVVVLLVYYSVSFAFIYASALDNQKEAFEDSAVMLAEDLNDYVTADNQTVYISSMFKDSPAYLNTLKTYPILDDLIPSNASLYWPNLLWFNTLTNLNVNLVGFDFNTINMDTLELLESNKLWDIYQLNGEIYVYTK